MALEVACDLLISISMTYYLQRERRHALQRCLFSVYPLITVMN